MTDSLLHLTEKLITFRSSSENKKELDVILDFCLGYVEGFAFERFERNGVQSVLVYNTKKQPKKFHLLLNGHLDIIPAKEFQFTPKREGNKLYGAGSMDMKAGVASLLFSFREMAKKVSYPLGLQLVTDEEIGGFDGTKYQIEEGVRSDFVLTSEPTNFNIVHQAKGILMVRVAAKGKTAHGAYPWRGQNAIWMMYDFLERIKKRFPLPKEECWSTTCNLSSIQTSNTAFNKIPDDCSVSLDIRFVHEDRETLLQTIEGLLPKGFVLEIVANEPALYTDPKNEYIQKLQYISEEITKNKILLRGAQGSSDARHFVRVNCPGIEFGPIGGGIGSDEEWVDIPSISLYTSIIKKFIASFDERGKR